MWKARYKLPDGRWQTWGIWEEWQEAKEAIEFHAKGREYEIIGENEDEEYREQIIWLNAGTEILVRRHKYQFPNPKEIISIHDLAFFLRDELQYTGLRELVFWIINVSGWFPDTVIAKTLKR